MKAARAGHMETVQFLMAHGTRVLHVLIIHVHIIIMCLLVFFCDAHVMEIHALYCAELCDVIAPSIIITVGADSNRITANNDHTVLSLACAGGHVGIVKYLLVQGADSGHILKVLTPPHSKHSLITLSFAG